MKEIKVLQNKANEQRKRLKKRQKTLQSIPNDSMKSKLKTKV